MVLAGSFDSGNGRIITLSAHGYSATVVTVGASIAGLEYFGRQLVRSFDPHQLRPAYSGAILAPWPNRVIDGRYTWDGVEHELALNERSRAHALHGLVSSSEFRVMSQDPGSVELHTLVPPRDGYPFFLRLRIGYTLELGGLRAEATATNLGRHRAPYGIGSHCYLVAPGARVDDWVLSLPADEVQQVCSERLVPQGISTVDQDDRQLDFRRPRRIADTRLDHAFTSLLPGSDGMYRVTVTDTQGRGAHMTWDTSCPWVQVHTADNPGSGLDRTGLAIEPMSCPPAAFNDGTSPIGLPPGTSHHASWLIGAIEPSPRQPAN